MLFPAPAPADRSTLDESPSHRHRIVSAPSGFGVDAHWTSWWTGGTLRARSRAGRDGATDGGRGRVRTARSSHAQDGDMRTEQRAKRAKSFQSTTKETRPYGRPFWEKEEKGSKRLTDRRPQSRVAGGPHVHAGGRAGRPSRDELVSFFRSRRVRSFSFIHSHKPYQRRREQPFPHVDPARQRYC